MACKPLPNPFPQSHPNHVPRTGLCTSIRSNTPKTHAHPTSTTDAGTPPRCRRRRDTIQRPFPVPQPAARRRGARAWRTARKRYAPGLTGPACARDPTTHGSGGRRADSRWPWHHPRARAARQPRTAGSERHGGLFPAPLAGLGSPGRVRCCPIAMEEQLAPPRTCPRLPASPPPRVVALRTSSSTTQNAGGSGGSLR
ncbi:hypothetical protein SEVIR_5G319633v4 [Setaria viridis]